jgi:hypothetical protein
MSSLPDLIRQSTARTEAVVDDGLDPLHVVMRGLDPRIHLPSKDKPFFMKRMDCRIEVRQ